MLLKNSTSVLLMVSCRPSHTEFGLGVYVILALRRARQLGVPYHWWYFRPSYYRDSDRRLSNKALIIIRRQGEYMCTVRLVLCTCHMWYDIEPYTSHRLIPILVMGGEFYFLYNIIIVIKGVLLYYICPRNHFPYLCPTLQSRFD